MQVYGTLAEWGYTKMNTVYVKQPSTVWKVIKILLIISAIGFVAWIVYKKFFQKKKTDLLDDADDLDELDIDMSDLDVDFDEDAFEVSAGDVIANAEDMA